MKILGNRVLVSKVEEEVKEGFKTVDVQDSFVNKGRIEQVGYKWGVDNPEEMKAGNIILFSKYSPDTQEIEHEGKKMKIVSIDDLLAIL